MRALRSILAVAVMLGASFPALAAEKLKLGGTGGIIEAMRQVAPHFKAATGIEMDVVAGLGSSGAIRALGDRVLDVVAAAREVKPDEAKTPLVARAFARTALVFVTSHAKPNGLKTGDIAGIYAADNPSWEDGTPLKIVLRTRLDADSALIEEAIPGVKDAIERARRRPDVPIAPTDQDNVAIAQRLPGSFTLAGLGQIVAEKVDLRVIAIDRVMPSLETLANKTYPYEKLFYLVFAADRSAGAEKLLGFLRSPEGRKILLSTGNLAIGE